MDSVVAKYSGDTANANSTSPTLAQTVTSVTDTTKPTVMITSPTDGATVLGVATITAKASDNVGIASFTLSIDGAVVATTNGTSISYKWNARKAAGGLHTITAAAKDTSGNLATPFTIQLNK